MIFDTEAAIITHLLPRCAPGSVILGTFDPIDLTDDSPTPVTSQVRLQRFYATDEVRGLSGMYQLHYVFSVFLDVHRASSSQRQSAATLLEDVASALIGWDYAPLRQPRLTDGQETEFDGRLLRLSIGFTLPVYFNAI